MLLEDTDIARANLLKKARDFGRSTVLLTNDAGFLPVTPLLKGKIQAVSHKHALLANAVSASGFINYEIESIFENFFIVETTIFEIAQSLKRKDIKKFPLVASKRHGKTIRLYALLEAFLAETHNKVDREVLLAFLAEYQKESPLSIREINAVPVILRLILVENFGSLIDLALQEVEEFSHADSAYSLVKKSIAVNAGNPTRSIALLASKYPLVPITFGTHLLERLSQEGAVMRPVIKWIRLNLEKQGMSLDKMSEVATRVSNNRSLITSNIVEALHWLNQVRWNSIAENINVVDSILSKDPAGVFTSLEMESKDIYRNVVVRIAEGVSVGEAEVSRAVLRLAQKAKSAERHVGYYLLDPIGRGVLERELKYIPTRSERIYKKIIFNSQKMYFGSITLVTFLTMFLFLVTVGVPTAGFILSLIWLVGILALSLEVGLVVVNIFLTQFLPVNRLPRIHIENDVGATRRTFVVVPSMLRSEQSIRNLVQNLEVRFLGNNEKNIYYALLFDFQDASRENLETDKVLVDCLSAEIKRLNVLYSEGVPKFFGLVRKRIWNDKEGVFMGWERKRGKLREFNQLLRGKKETSYLNGQNILAVGHVQYVITLDEDTQLPRDTARKLIGTIAHPLNAPVVNSNGTVLRGYGIIQPRMAVRLEVAAKSIYSRLYSSGSGIDSYSGPVSDVYQDLFGNALFFGKGIYDIDALERSMSDKIPDNMVLSHDLLEGLYARTGFASDIVLFDGFPNFYHEFIIRLERWIRGDWQIIGWLFSRREAFSAIDRFKIFDNLRRSLVSVVAVVVLLVGSLIYTNPLFVVLEVVAVLIISQLISFCISLVRLYDVPLRLYIPKMAHDFWVIVTQMVLKIFFLLQLALISAKAIIVTIFRLLISRRKLLRWKSSHDVGSVLRGNFWEHYFLFSWSIIVSICGLVYLGYSGLWFSWPAVLFVFWILAPIVAVVISRPIRKSQKLDLKDESFVRTIAYKNALYFLENANEATSWLVPDHFQECPVLSQESRITTSPTNIGMQILALICAFKLGYISPLLFKDRTEKLFKSLAKLPRFRGHFMNWYDIARLEPIHPQYVSSVDSANFLLVLLTAKQAYQEFSDCPIVGPSAVKGLFDALAVFIDDAVSFERTAPRPIRKNVKEIIASSRAVLLTKKIPSKDASLQDYSEIFADFYARVYHIFHNVRSISAHDPQSISNRLLIAVERVMSVIEDHKKSLEGLVPNIKNSKSFAVPTFGEIAEAKDMITSFEGLQSICTHYIDETDFAFLYNKEKELFHIGYNVVFNKMDNACYNFMASEANSISFMAILKRDVPQKHWFYLGRKLVRVGGLVSLISWGGSLFEYLTSLIFFPAYQDSLLGNTAQAAIKVHMQHAKVQKTLWGMGESAQYQFDVSKQYQYQIFGSPALGLKRNLNDFLVVAPYTTALAMPFFLSKAVRNLKGFVRNGMSGLYGFYDALDYGGNGKNRLKKPRQTKTYYAHHQGFTLASLTNVLAGNYVQKLFQANPAVKSLEVLFQEKIPDAPIAEELSAPVPVSFAHISRTRDTGLESKRFIPLHSVSSRYAFVANGDYSVQVSSSGTSMSFYKGLALTRPSLDPEFENQGMFFYLKNKKTKSSYSLLPRPAERHHKHKVIFYENKVEFLGSYPSLDTALSISVDPQSPVEVRECILHNTGQVPLSLDLTAYAEVSLAYPQQIFHHPHYHYLLVRAEKLRRENGIVFYRPHPDNATKMIYSAHILVSKSLSKKSVQLSTSRNDVLARFGEYPIATSLSRNPKKATIPLDPASCINSSLEIAAGESASIVWLQIVAQSREELDRLIKKYKKFNRAHAVTTHAITESASTTRERGISQEQSVMFQEMASQVLAGSISSQTNTLALNERNDKEPLIHALWRMGISGDRPIALFLIHDIEDMQTVKQAIQCYEYLQSKGMFMDIVILNNQPASYIKVLDDEVDFMIRQVKDRSPKEVSCCLYQVKSDLITKDDRMLLLTLARFVMDSHTDTLRQALDKKYKEARLLKTQKLTPTLKIRGHKQTLAADQNLLFYNSWGGFDRATNEYVMTLSSDRMPPYKWNHIIAQPDFGTIISDCGSTYTWSVDSYDNRITARTTEMLRYQSSEIVYLRDNETGEIWNPTPLPVETKEPFVVKYGFGYATYESVYAGLQQKFTTFVSPSDTVKVSLLSLKNTTKEDRSLTLYYYIEPSMAVLRSHVRDHLSFNYDASARSLFFANEFRNQMPGRTAFLSFGRAVGEIGWTTDKREFIGQLGSYHLPAALRKENLSNSTPHGSENCIALSLKIVLRAGEQVEVPFLLADAPSAELAKEKSLLWKDSDKYQKTLVEVKDFWKQKLGAVAVQTGDLSIDVLMNGWLLYQTISSRLFAKTGSYQPSGAYGFRDQLQDVCALVWSDSAFVRKFILKAAAHQFKEGDVLNWWHDHNMFGSRTVLSDHQLWLAHTLFEYINATRDYSIFNEEVAFLEAPLLSFTDKKEWTGVPTVSSEKASVFEHAMRGIEKSLVFGAHSLPLIGHGDWNDGLSKVGTDGKGESVWTAWFLLRLITLTLPYLKERGELERVAKFSAASVSLQHAVKKFAWDGKWYRRAYFDNGTALGSKSLREFKIDSVAQSWSVLSGAGDKEQSLVAHKSMTKMLLFEKYFALINPALVRGFVKPGYLQDYPAGVRENGAQYNHAALWAVQSYLHLGENEMAEKILSLVNPVKRTDTFAKAMEYRIEPYVVASDIYGDAYAGRGGWSWYTGSAGVMYRTILEHVLGIRRHGETLSIAPNLLKSMGNEVTVSMSHGTSLYRVTIKKSVNISQVISATRDGVVCDASAVPFVDDGAEHQIVVTLG